LNTSLDTIKPLDVIVHNASKWQSDSTQSLSSALSSFCNVTCTIADSERLTELKLDAELQRCFDAISNTLVSIIPETSTLMEQPLAIANIITDVQRELNRMSSELEMLSSEKGMKQKQNRWKKTRQTTRKIRKAGRTAAVKKLAMNM
jgi:hypothetical protein